MKKQNYPIGKTEIVKRVVEELGLKLILIPLPKSDVQYRSYTLMRRLGVK